MKSISTTYPKVNATWDIPGGNVWIQDFATPPRKTSYQEGILDSLFYEDTIDLSAFFVQDQTFFSANVEVMEPGLTEMGPNETYYNNKAALIVLDVVSSVPLSMVDVVTDVSNGIFPGGSESGVDMQFILFGRARIFGANVNASYPGLVMPVASHNFGAGLPTAADKLFSYRIVYPQNMNLNLATLKIPETTLTFVGEATKESELGRIYRLRQSYEQKQG